jgi:Glycosyl transferase 4-like
MKKILYIVNVDWFFISHRLPIAKEALAKGYEIHIACALTGREEELKSSGLIVHPVPFARSEGGLFKEFKTFLKLVGIISYD